VGAQGARAEDWRNFSPTSGVSLVSASYLRPLFTGADVWSWGSVAAQQPSRMHR